MSIDAAVTPAIILGVAVLAIFAMIVYYWIRTTYGQCTSYVFCPFSIYGF
jgi:hypothetical protein